MFDCCCCKTDPIICKQGCNKGGKAAVLKSNKLLTINIDPNLTAGRPRPGTLIRVHRWSQLPNIQLQGISLFTEVAQGGQVQVLMPSPFQWISIFAKNPIYSGDGYYDGCCFNLNGNIITILGFN